MIKRFFNAPKLVRLAVFAAASLAFAVVTGYMSWPIGFYYLFASLAFVFCYYPECVIYVSLWLFRAKRMDQVIAVCNYGLGLMPDSYWLLVNRSAALLTKKRAEEARADTNRAVQLAPKVWQGWCNSASAALQLKDYGGAESDAARAIELAPKRSKPYVLRAAARFSNYNSNGCLEDCIHFQQDSRLAPLARMLTISSHLMAADIQSAEVEVQKLPAKVAPGSHDALGLALFKYHKNEFADMLSICADTSEHSPMAFSFMLLQSYAYRGLNEGELALHSALRTIALDQRQGPGYEVRALVLADGGHLDAALAEVCRKEVSNSAATLGDAEAYVRWRRGEFAEMLGCSQRAIKRHPTGSFGIALNSLALAGLGQTDEALQAALKATRLNSLDALAWYALADVYLDQDQVAQAIKSLDTGLTVDPCHRLSYQLRAEAHRRAGHDAPAARDQAKYEELRAQYMANLNLDWLGAAEAE